MPPVGAQSSSLLILLESIVQEGYEKGHIYVQTKHTIFPTSHNNHYFLQ